MKDIQMIFKHKESIKETYFIREFGFLQFILLRGLFVCLSVCLFVCLFVAVFSNTSRSIFHNLHPMLTSLPPPIIIYLSPMAWNK